MGSKVGLATIAVTLAVCGAAWAGDGAVIGVSGVAVRAPEGWTRARAAPSEGSETDPRTVLVVGTPGVEPRRSQCQVSAYRIPVDGAAVVVIAWRGKASDAIPRDRDVLDALRLRRPYFTCWTGRGAAAQISLHGRAYQVNVLVGDRAGPRVAAEALRVARSFDASE